MEFVNIIGEISLIITRTFDNTFRININGQNHEIYKQEKG